ncbi:hypothetical protein KAW50_06220, partial [candidate division WOR-3 bacterium]|nr:hypothetical protein [candidate division WOR-3 bacterium]
KEIVKYDLYLAYLSGLSTPEIISLYKKANNSETLSGVKKRLEETFANKEFIGARTSLSQIQKTFSEINTVLEAKVTAPKARNKSLQREFDGKDTIVKGYTNTMFVLGGCYFRLHNLFLKGKYKEIISEISLLQELSGEFSKQVKGYFVNRNKVPVQLPADSIEFLKHQVDALEKKHPASFPNPGEMFR